jgi:hypothetical protein
MSIDYPIFYEAILHIGSSLGFNIVDYSGLLGDKKSGVAKDLPSFRLLPTC